MLLSEPENFNRRYSIEREKEVPARNEYYEKLFSSDILSVQIDTHSYIISLELRANIHDGVFTAFKLLDDISKNNQKINIKIKQYARDGSVFYERMFGGAYVNNSFRNVFNSLSYENVQLDTILNVEFKYDYYQENII